jgi:hypothetical protein
MRCPVVWQQRTDVSEDSDFSVFKAVDHYSLIIPQSVYVHASCNYKHLGQLGMQTQSSEQHFSPFSSVYFRLGTRGITNANDNSADLTTVAHTNVTCRYATSLNACKSMSL